MWGRVTANVGFMALILLLAPRHPAWLVTTPEGLLWVIGLGGWGIAEGLGWSWALAVHAAPARPSALGRWLDRGVGLCSVAALTVGLRQWEGGPLPLLAQTGFSVLIGCGIALRLWAMRTLREHFHAGLRLEGEAVRTGPYKFTPHPAYLGLLFILSGLMGLLQSGWGFALVAGGVLPCLAVRGILERRKF